MKVLLVSGVYPPDVGGPAAQTQHIACGLRERGIEACVVTMGPRPPREERDDVPVTYVDAGREPGLPAKVRRNVFFYRRLSQVIATFQPDVLHANSGVGALTFWAGLAARRHGVPSLLKYAAGSKQQIADAREHSLPLSKRLARRVRYLQWAVIERAVLALYPKIWATTPRYGERLARTLRVPERKVWVWPNFLDLRLFRAAGDAKEAAERDDASGDDASGDDASGDDAQGQRCRSEDLVLLTVCRLRHWKGLEECVAALAHLREQGLPVQLRMVGEGTDAYEARLRDQAERLGVADCVEFRGRVPHEHIAEEYRRADLFILASHHEPFGIVLVEAMAAGVPIVATEVGGIPTVTEGEAAARLVPAREEAALAAALQELVQDEGTRRALTQAGRERARRFGLEAGLDALIEHYETLQRE